MQKSTKTKEIRVPKQFKFLPLNNTDMADILDTPPNSPGQASDFLGFPDFDDDETICEDFCGFTEEEQNKLLSHRLSRDSGVGVDPAILTPEKEPLEIIFEENAAVNTASCAVDLSEKFAAADQPNTSGTAKDSTEDILSKLPTSIRNVLEAEMEEGAKEITGAASNTSENEQNKAEDGPINKSLAEQFEKALLESDSQKENVTTASEDQTLKVDLPTVVDENVTKESVVEVPQPLNEADNANKDKETDKQNMEPPQLSDLNCTTPNEDCAITAQVPQAVIDADNTNIDMKSDNQNMESPQQSDTNCSAVKEDCAITEETAVKEQSENANVNDVNAADLNPNSADKLSIPATNENDINAADLNPNSDDKLPVPATNVNDVNAADLSPNSDDKLPVPATNVDDRDVGLDNECNGQSSQEDNDVFDLSTHGAKTKVMNLLLN